MNSPSNPSPEAATDRANSPLVDEAATRPWQYSLRGLLLLTTAATVASAIAAARGVSSLIMSSGVIFTAFNAAGYLARWQTPKWQPRWIYLGWLLFLCSLLLPSVKGCNDEQIPGWRVATGLVLLEADAVILLATKEESRAEVWNHPLLESIQTALLYLALTAANLIMVAVPLMALAWHRERARLLFGILLCGAATAWLLTWKDDPDILLGYYVWCASMLCVLAHQRIPWRYAIASWCLAAFYIVSLTW